LTFSYTDFHCLRADIFKVTAHERIQNQKQKYIEEVLTRMILMGNVIAELMSEISIQCKSEKIKNKPSLS
jgi:hypothetical protein